jgi:hypothetical protein
MAADRRAFHFVLSPGKPFIPFTQRRDIHGILDFLPLRNGNKVDFIT